MSIPIRSTLLVLVGLALGSVASEAQSYHDDNFRWYVGGQGGVFVFRTPNQSRGGIPMFGGHTLIKARRTGLLLSVEEGVGDDEVTSYTDGSGTQSVVFNDVRRYQGVLMAFPVRSAVQPFLGVGLGIQQVVSPRPVSSGDAGIAAELGSSGFGTLLGGVQFAVGRFMAFGHYQISTAPRERVLADNTGAAFAAGRLINGATHILAGGLRISLGGSRESIQGGGY